VSASPQPGPGAEPSPLTQTWLHGSRVGKWEMASPRGSRVFHGASQCHLFVAAHGSTAHADPGCPCSGAPAAPLEHRDLDGRRRGDALGSLPPPQTAPGTEKPPTLPSRRVATHAAVKRWPSPACSGVVQPSPEPGEGSLCLSPESSPAKPHFQGQNPHFLGPNLSVLAHSHVFPCSTSPLCTASPGGEVSGRC